MIKKLILSAGIILASLNMAYAGSWQQNVSVGGFNNVHIYTPDSDSAVGQGKALMIVLHGCVQPINNYLTANLEDAAQAHGMVIAVPDAMNKAGYSCWSYWQGAINRSSGDYKNLINLANTLSSDSSRNIDADQVYIAGLSSGAAFAAQTACVAPDVFAGVAPSAGPTIGTSSNGAITTCETVSTSTFKSRCEGYAGSYKSHFSTQVAVIGHGTSDTTVNTCYNQQNADGFANVYGVNQLSGTTTISDDATRTASQTLWTDNRVAMVWFDSLDHSWSGGAGASGDYVAGNSINFATYLGQYFADNNKRVNRNQGPAISNQSAQEQSSTLVISGTAIDPEGSVNQVSITISALDSGTPVVVETLTTTVNGSNAFTATSSTLADGLYAIDISATDDQSQAGDSVTLTERVGPEPPATAPSLSNINADVAGQCAVITGTVVDINQNLSTVVVSFANGDVTASVTGNSYRAEQCNLAGGSNNATVTATDVSALTATDSVSFNIDAGVTGDYNLHINEGNITWGVGYSACYLEFGTAAFTMREYPSGTSQCQWIADGAPACAGPAQACSSGGGTGGGDGGTGGGDGGTGGGDGGTGGGTGGFDCTESTSSNYSHVLAGRATTNGAYTYAVGSGENLGLYNVFVTTTLAETSDGYYELGSCPN